MTSSVFKNSGRSVRSARMKRQPAATSAIRARAARRGAAPAVIATRPAPASPTGDGSRRAGAGSSWRIARRLSADSAKLAAFATTVVAGPSRPIAAPPSGGPRIVAVQVVDSKRAFARSSSSRGTSAFR
nr:hypothetical protein [Solirubrobacter pauli]